MARFTRKDLLYVADLARLEIPEAEMESRLREFNEMVGYIEKLNELTTEEIEPTFQVAPNEGRLGTPMAQDLPQPSLPPEAVVQNAPQKQDHFFVVPRMLEDQET